MNDTMRIEVISKESIRPLFPTPNNIRTHILSSLDQLFPSLYVDHLLYYPNLDSNDSSLGDDEDDKNMILSVSSRRRCDVLRKSLAETLTRYYPLAGRIKDDKSVDCNDEGVDYIEVRVIGRVVSQVTQLASSDDIEVMEPFLPYEPYGGTGSAFRRGVLHLNSKALLKIQVNVFDCGGIILCLSYSHKIVDASSFVNFVNDWAATARGDSGNHDDKLKVAATGKPCYIFSSMFPPTSSGDKEEKDTADIQIVTDKIKIVTKRFVFKDSSIAILKKKCIAVKTNNGSDYQVNKQEENMQQLPTRFEALTSLILMCFMDVHRSQVKLVDDGTSPVNAEKAVPKQVQYIAGFAINLRTRTIPPLPANSFGNMTDTAIAEVPRNLTGSNIYNNGKGFHDQSQYYPELVSKIKNSIKLVDNEHVKAMKRNLGTSCNHMKMHQMLKEGTFDHETTELLLFSSWCRFPIFEADFGWGKPSWASISKLLFKNCVMFIDTSSGDGVEAWISLKEEDMVEFERHEELLASAS